MMTALTSYETALVQDAELMLAKNRIIEKAGNLFQQVYHQYKQLAPEKFSADVLAVGGKISKGEKYEGLPYVVLDYPRIFTNEHVFAIRSLFWWGNDFVITLHLKGKYQQRYSAIIEQHAADGKLEGWWIQYHGDQWQHAVGNSYELFVTGKRYSLSAAPFVKIAKKIPLQQWDQSVEIFVRSFTALAEMLYAPIL